MLVLYCGECFCRTRNRSEHLMKDKKRVSASESQTPAPCAATHGSVSEMGNSGGTHVSGCTVKYVEHSRVYRVGEPALIRVKQTWFYLFSFA